MSDKETKQTIFPTQEEIKKLIEEGKKDELFKLIELKKVTVLSNDKTSELLLIRDNFEGLKKALGECSEMLKKETQQHSEAKEVLKVTSEFVDVVFRFILETVNNPKFAKFDAEIYKSFDTVLETFSGGFNVGSLTTLVWQSPSLIGSVGGIFSLDTTGLIEHKWIPILAYAYHRNAGEEGSEEREKFNQIVPFFKKWVAVIKPEEKDNQ